MRPKRPFKIVLTSAVGHFSAVQRTVLATFATHEAASSRARAWLVSRPDLLLHVDGPHGQSQVIQ